ncbi:hypothetical protein MXMO3_02713 [Maritalea myrionectae]|uniref:DUF3422 domain-containing protein n=2 Tax=Maritalea myrionectae TaxID=454601 RepID=A0A2R4MH72_9HYPH|nr:hypothetical protein MXMO3_02713 [Maritalea myrionectae]
MQFVDHPFRAQALGEIHARPVQPLGPKGRLRRVATYFGREPGRHDQMREEFASWCHKNQIKPTFMTDRQARYQVGEIAATWQLHSEHASITWMAPSTLDEPWPENIGLEAITAAKLLVTTRVDLIDAETVHEEALKGFRRASLSYAKVEEGLAEIATDFLPDNDGFTRLEFAGAGITDVRRGVIARYLLEIETFRSLALLALPVAQDIAPNVDNVERGLENILKRLNNETDPQIIEELLNELNKLALETTHFHGETNALFAASYSYDQLVRHRLGLLEEKRITGHTNMARYLSNRMDPAMATCAALQNRLNALTDRLTRATELLNTKVAIEIHKQNQDALKAISDTSVSQYKLQTTVEGLSTIAITYYALGVLGYILAGMQLGAFPSKSLMLAVAAPFVLALTWLAMRHIRQLHDKH